MLTLVHKRMLTYILLCIRVWEAFDFGSASPAINPSINLSSLLSLSLTLSPALCFCRLDLSQLCAGFKDKEILIELLCNSRSQCITRQLDINRPPFVRVHLHVCVCACVRKGTVWACVSVVKSLPIDPTRGCCDLLLQPGPLSLEISSIGSVWASTICVFT